MDIDFSPAITQLQDMINAFIAAVPNLIVALVLFALFYLLARAVQTLIQRVVHRAGKPSNLSIVLGRLFRWATILFGLLIGVVIVFPDVSPAQLFQLLGISSVAIGFAFRDVLQNFFAGVLLLVNEPFGIGDQIIIEDFEGTVEDIQTRATTIKTYDGRRVVMPNTELFTNPVIVNTAFPLRRIEYDVGIGYGDDIERAKALILETLRGVSDIRQEPAPEVLVVGLADSSVTLRVRWWIEPALRAEAVDTRNQVLALVKRTLMGHGIDLPFPTRQILFHDQTEETDGDRRLQREGWPAGDGPVPEPRTIAQALQSHLR
jgi:small-conductance mechanosensitive channel